MKKKLLLVLMLIAAVVVIPRVNAEEAKTITLGNVEDITNENTLISEDDETTKSIDVTDKSAVTITYDAATFKLLDNGADEEVERPEGYAWIGLRVTNATNATKYSVKFNGTETETTDATVSNSSFDDYIGFKVADLTKAAEAGTNLEFIYEITWEADDAEPVTQTIKVVINPKGITLKDEDEEEVWNEAIYKEKAKVTINVVAVRDGKVVELEEPLSLTVGYEATLSKEELDKVKTVLEDADLVGLYTDDEYKNEFNPEAKLTENTTIYVVYKTKAKVVEEEAPDTIDNAIMYIALAGASILVASGVAVYYKRFN